MENHGKKAVMENHGKILYFAIFAYCEFVNKTGRVKVYDSPCLQSFDCWYGAITCLSSYMILGCFPGYHRSKAACYFVHCEFSVQH